MVEVSDGSLEEAQFSGNAAVCGLKKFCIARMVIEFKFECKRIKAFKLRLQNHRLGRKENS
jgi:hypothetical protein